MSDSEQETVTDRSTLFTSIHTPYMQEHLSGHDMGACHDERWL